MQQKIFKKLQLIIHSKFIGIKNTPNQLMRRYILEYAIHYTVCCGPINLVKIDCKDLDLIDFITNSQENQIIFDFGSRKMYY